MILTCFVTFLCVCVQLAGKMLDMMENTDFLGNELAIFAQKVGGTGATVSGVVTSMASLLASLS